MARTTGIELRPNSCVIAAARQASGGIEVSAIHVIEPAQWPSHDLAVTAALDDVRRSKRLPRRAGVVVWGLPEDAMPDEPSTRAAVRPLTAAGFKVGTVMTPAQALASLAGRRARRSDSGNGTAAVAWLALNTYGAAIAIVRGTELLFSRSFEWTYRPGPAGSKAQLLQRYTLVAHLAPELRRGMAHVRSAHGVSVSTAVTCGDLPELRSLTMPLIEELDIEVETLDSLDGLRAVGGAKAERFTEWAPAIRLAAAAALASRGRSRFRMTPLMRAAAGVVAVVGVAWAAVTLWPMRAPDVPVQTTTQSWPRAGVAGGQGTAGNVAGTPLSTEANTAAAAPQPPAATPQPPPENLNAVTEPASRKSAAQPGRAAPAVQAEKPAVKPAPPRRAAEPPVRRPVPLDAALPVIDSILIDHNRRLAIIDGAILRVGDVIGPRVVVRIDPQAVVFREPSGLDVLVPLRRGSNGPAKSL